MCGICGIYNYNKTNPVKENVLRAMCGVMSHRGPDGEGVYLNYPLTGGGMGVGLGHRRLAIIDLSTGEQPMYNEDKSIAIVFNGEIYNFQELRPQLESLGHKFRSNSDTEAIVHAYEQYGEDCVDHLRGMFAFAIWDNNNTRMFIARDRVGKKPLYYANVNGSLIFASEIKALLKYPGIGHEINKEAIHYYLNYQYVPGPKTVYNSVFRLMPAHCMSVDKNGNLRTREYWDIDFREKTKLSFNDTCTQLREVLKEATRLRMISDVPLGAFLSGGHDSSIIVGLMSELASKPVKTFSIGFEEEEFSELGYAKIVAQHFKTDHQEFIVKPQFVEILPKLVWHYDQPYADSSALPSYYVANMTRKNVTVALNGDGGDESFGGYLRYKAMKGSLYAGLPFKLLGRKNTLRLAEMLPHTETAGNIKMFRYMYRLVSALAEPPQRRNVYWHSYFDNTAKDKIYSVDMRNDMKGIDSFEYLEKIFENAKAGNVMDRTFYTDIKAYLPECLLIKMDIASMANSLETRSPFLDHVVMEYAAGLPDNWKIRGFRTKHILKETFKSFLPKEIINRPKQGFGIPLGKWFRNQLKGYIQEILLDPKTVSRGYFNRQGLEILLKEHMEAKRDHGYRLWALLMLELWHREVYEKL
ncbi:MAG: asparagine synthase (glutamine-hydrolyzing) [Elusimicrobiota bacterium]